MISAIVLTKNEEENIKACLETLKWCDEIIVVDDKSTDHTCKIARKMSAKIVTYFLDNDFSRQRNFALSLAKGDWILFIDADERVTPKLAKEIKETLASNSEADGFLMKRKDFLFGKWLKHGEVGNIKLLRLAKKNAGTWIRRVHEVWQVKGRIEELNNPLLHYPHQTLTEFLKEINSYSTINAEVFLSEGKKVAAWEIIAYPLVKFIKNYFLKLGFLDGTPGFIHATLMSFHSFLTRGKIWCMQKKL